MQTFKTAKKTKFTPYSISFDKKKTSYILPDAICWAEENKSMTKIEKCSICGPVQKHGNAGHYRTSDILMKFGHFLIDKWYPEWLVPSLSCKKTFFENIFFLHNV